MSAAIDETVTAHRKGHPVWKVIGAIVGAVVICVVVYAIVLYTSFSQVRTQVDQVQQEVQTLQTSFDKGDVATLHATATDLSGNLGSLKDELNGWQWSVATVLPQYGSDVVAGRQLVDVADSLVSGALLPATTVANDYAENISDKGILGVFDTELAGKMADALTDAAPVIKEASTALDAIEPAHSSEINDAVNELRGPVNKMAQLLDEYGTLAGHLEGLFSAAA